MKGWQVAGVGVLFVCLGVACYGGDESSDVGSRLRKYCDPVCQIQSQDSAFSLLLETYRQFQSYQIETDYENRQRAIAGIRDEDGSLVIASTSKGQQTMRSFMLALARREYDLRMQKLSTEVVNFRSAYGCVRKMDEDEVGEPVNNRVDMRAAADQLKNFVILSSGPLARADLRSARAVPASTVLVDAPPVDPDPRDVIDPCE
jgi:hypothetical protein